MTTSPTSDWIGQRLCDRYEIRQELGRAVGRRTLLADNLQARCPVVIKIITFGQDFEWANLRLFEREAEVLKSLHHQDIPDYLDYFEIDRPQDKGYALVQSYAEGQSLQGHLQGGRTFNETDVIDIARRLLAILQYLHSQTPPIVHRDLKPSNILLCDRTGHSQGALYLVDFGSVQAPFLHPTGTLTIVGTYGYMPPEQFGGRAEPASDLYSLGATLIYLVTGHHPAELPQQNLRIRFEPKAMHIGRPLRQWLCWLTNPDLTQRPASATEALTGLETLLETGSLAELRHPSPDRILVNQRADRLDIVVPPRGFQPKRVGSWLDLISLAVIFSVASSVVGLIGWPLWMLIGTRYFEMGIWVITIIRLLYGILGIAAGLIAITLLPTSARNNLLRQLHLRLDEHSLMIYRESSILWRRRRVMFQAKREEIETLEWEPTQDSLKISGSHSCYRLDRQKLGLTTTEFQWLAQELSDSLGVPLSTLLA
ncbi:MAG: serine/threonine-protein kinase [Cyanobacteria bacterium P01_G01_bin.38]